MGSNSQLENLDHSVLLDDAIFQPEVFILKPRFVYHSYTREVNGMIWRVLRGFWHFRRLGEPLRASILPFIPQDLKLFCHLLDTSKRNQRNDRRAHIICQGHHTFELVFVGKLNRLHIGGSSCGILYMVLEIALWSRIATTSFSICSSGPIGRVRVKDAYFDLFALRTCSDWSRGGRSSQQVGSHCEFRPSERCASKDIWNTIQKRKKRYPLRLGNAQSCDFMWIRTIRYVEAGRNRNRSRGAAMVTTKPPLTRRIKYRNGKVS